jgi:hypothetical protein
VLADGSRLFSGSTDNTIKVWDVATGACLQTLEGHARAVCSVCVSADGSRLFSGSVDNTIRVWNIPVSQVSSSSSSMSSASAVSQVSSSSSSMSSAAALSSEVPDELRCPIGYELFKDPVLAGDGFNYERAQIVRWFQNHATSPKTNAVLPNTTLTPNHELRTRCLEWKELHSTEAGFKKQLIAITGALLTAETPADALAAVSKIGDLLELARSQNFLILGPAGVAKLLNQAQFTNAVDDQVASAFAVLQSQSAAHVGEFQEKYRHLQTERSANAAAAQTFAGSDKAILRDMTKAEQKEAVAKRKDAAAKKKLDAAQAAWEKTTAAVRSAQAETGRLQKSLETNAKEKQSFGKLEEDLAAQSKAVIKMLEAVGEQVNDEAQAVEGGEGGASSSSSSSSGSTSKRKGRGSSSRSSTRVSKRAKKGRKN